jgi:CheY-like chemotaxis protein
MKSAAQQKQKRILLVEDEPAYRTLLLSILRKGGLHCTFCINGEQAMKIIGQEQFDLIIIDYLLPGPNAIEIIQWTRGKGIETPVLIITNYPSIELKLRGKSLGETSVLAKSEIKLASLPDIILGWLTS